ncbi:hypothetical protein ABPG73_017270 [Tetrahymena malaccensis]
MKIENLISRFCGFLLIFQPLYTLILYYFLNQYVASFVDKIDDVDKDLDFLKNNLLKDYIQNVYIVSESENCGKASKYVGPVISKNKLMKLCFEYYLRGNYLNVTQQQDENKIEFQSCEYKGITILSKKKMCPITEILLSSQDLIEGYESVTDFLYQNNRIFFKREDSELQPLVDIFTDSKLQNSLQKSTNITFAAQELCNFEYNLTVCNYEQLQKNRISFSIEQRYSQIKQECEKEIFSYKEYKPKSFLGFKEFWIVTFLLYILLQLVAICENEEKFIVISHFISTIWTMWYYFSSIQEVYHIHLLDQIGLDKGCFTNSNIPQEFFEYNMQLDIYFYLNLALAFFTVFMCAIIAVCLFLRQAWVKITKNKRYDNLQEEQDIQNTNNQNVIQIEQIQINQNKN